MSSPDTTPLGSLSLAELRDLVGGLVSEVVRLRADTVAQQATITALKAENQALRDEVARLKGLPPRPPLRPSGMEQATGGGTGTGKGGKRSRRRRGAKRDREAVSAEVVVKAAPPPGSRFKGYQDILVRELHLSAEVVRYRRERWLTPSGETLLAPLPAGVWGNAPNRRLRAGAAPLPPRRPRPGAGDDGAADGAAQWDRRRDLQAPGGAAADLAARRLHRRGRGRAAHGAGHGALDHGGRHRGAARPPGRRHHADRRRAVHRLPDRPLEVARFGACPEPSQRCAPGTAST
jgi:uncharacterized small protein (DUF1192 family)